MTENPYRTGNPVVAPAPPPQPLAWELRTRWGSLWVRSSQGQIWTLVFRDAHWNRFEYSIPWDRESDIEAIAEAAEKTLPGEPLALDYKAKHEGVVFVHPWCVPAVGRLTRRVLEALRIRPTKKG